MRAWVTLLILALLAAPLTAESQQKVPRIGVIVPVEPASPTEPNLAAFRRGLHDLGYMEGQNVVVEYRYAHGKVELYPKLTVELVGLRVDVMVVGSWQPALAAKKATQTIPIVGVGMGMTPFASGSWQASPAQAVTSRDRHGLPGWNSRASGWSC